LGAAAGQPDRLRRGHVMLSNLFLANIVAIQALLE
jgi:hypothetical protein